MKLFKKNAAGNLMYWEIDEVDYGLRTAWGVIGGQEQEHYEDVLEGLQGRDVQQQVEFRMASLIKKKKDIGYVEDQTRAANEKPTNALGFPMPMLAKPHTKVKPFELKHCGVQYKYDGHRCLICITEQGPVAYTRKGIVIETIEHILEDVADLPVGKILDGELYCHGATLQSISSWAKRLQPNSKKLKFHAYDLISPTDYQERYMVLKELIHFEQRSSVTVVPTVFGKTNEDLPKMFDEARELGYEGLIIRRPGVGYEDGKRSSSLIKLKKMIDEEFKVINITPSKDGWAILRCVTNIPGKEFTVSAPGSHWDKEQPLVTPEKFIGRYVTVEFSGWTNEGKPFHPVALRWKEEL